jgi:hypothetical protein
MNDQNTSGQFRQVTEDELKMHHAKMAAKAAQMQADPWVHRSTGMRCKTCLWFVLKEPSGLVAHPGQQEIGRCRRHAPTMGGYPVVYMTDWCGDHRIDENKV